MCSNSCVSEWLSITAADATIGSFCVYPYSDTKGQLKCVCVKWLQHSTASATPFTRKSRVTATPGQWNHTNTQKTQSHYTQRAWESFWPLQELWERETGDSNKADCELAPAVTLKPVPHSLLYTNSHRLLQIHISFDYVFKCCLH